MKRKALQSVLALACILLLALPALPASAALDPAIYDYGIVSGTSSLNLRDGPGTQYNWVASASENTWVGILGEVDNWYRVYVPSISRYGYMSKNFIKRSSGGGGSGSNTGVVSNPKATQFLNLRQYPDYNAPVLGIYYNGATFLVLSSSNGWVHVNIGGLEGYFRQEFVKINGSSGGGIIDTAYIHTANGGKLNLRNAPTYNGSGVIAQYNNGTQVSVLLKGRSYNGSAFWKVTVQGATGYMDAAYLSSGSAPYVPPTPPYYPPTSGYGIVNNPKSTQVLNLRAQASTTAKVLAQYKNGIRLEIVEPGETWCKVYGSASGLTGYVMTKYLRLYGVPSSPTKTVQNGSTFVNLRSAPSQQSGAVYQRVYSGAVVTVLAPGDQWTQVRYNGTVGYMMSYFLK